MRNFLVAILSLMALSSCNVKVEISEYINEKAHIYPDYADCTIPLNIAPLNFYLEDVDDARLLVSNGSDEFWVKSDDGDFELPEKKWHSLLAKSAGRDVEMTVCVRRDGRWVAMKPFLLHIAQEPVDSYLVYRLIPPGYVSWREMGIYQRNLENFDQEAIITNQLTDMNCVNCHSFCMQNPEEMLFHSRAKHPGTIMAKDGKIEKLDTKTDNNISAFVYPSWHPGGRFVAFSTNATNQSFYANHPNRIEVYDSASDVVVYDSETHRSATSPHLSSATSFETFPTFSPDGRTLYFCSADAVDSMPENHQQVHYSLCSLSFDPSTMQFGNHVDTLYNAHLLGKSVSFPRVSPDGKYLVFTLHDFGNFSIWHKEADLFALNTSNRTIEPLSAANSSDTESFHSWSSNSKWLVFSSRRDDGLFTRLYLCYIDSEGKACKPFLLPQKHPLDYYKKLMLSYNIPELIKDKVKVSKHDFIRALLSEDVAKCK